MSLGGGGGQLQELSQQLQAIEQEQEYLNEKIEGMEQEKAEIDEAIEALGVLESGSTVQVPLGGEAYVRATVDDIDEVVVNIGGGFAAEKDQDGAQEALERRKDIVDDKIEEVREDIASLEEESDRIEQQAQQAQQQMMQQQMAAQQEQDDQE